MKSRVMLPVLTVCVFIVGLIAGAWVEWHAWVHRPHVFHYQVEPYDQADLIVHKGDHAVLEGPDGPDASLAMNFVGQDSPCKPGEGGSSTCTINGAYGGEYLFSCAASDGSGLSCPDPGWQQIPVQPPPPPGQIPAPVRRLKQPSSRGLAQFFESLVIGIEYLFVPGVDLSQAEIQEYSQHTLQAKITTTATLGASVYVFCDQGSGATDILNRPVSGHPNWPNRVPTGQQIFWSTHDNLTLAPSGLPELCAQPPVQGSGDTWTCLAGTPSATPYSYTAKLDSCSAASQPQQIIVTASAKKGGQ